MENKEVQISHHNKTPMKELNLRNAKTMKEEYSSSSVLFKSLSNISAKSEKICISGNSLLFKSQNIDDFQDLPVILEDKLYKKSDMHLKTYCFNCIQDTSRPIDINEAINDLLYIFEEYMNPSEKEISDHIKYCYKEYLDKDLTPTECITMIWTYGRTFTKILNCAMVTDSVYTYDLKEKNFNFYVETLEK